MKLFYKAKDGGSESNVTGYWLIEWKPVFSVVLLRFDRGSREAFHSHAFHAVSWILRGRLREHALDSGNAVINILLPSWLPVFTPRDRLHKVYGEAEHTWVLSFRGPWLDNWKGVFPEKNKTVILTHGRKEIKVT